jgi:hypothetical protein
MKNTDTLAYNVANVVYTPTMISSLLIVVHWVRFGLCLYLLALVVAYLSGVFHQWRNWPIIAKVVLMLGPAHIALSLFCASITIAYWMIIPIGVQGVLNVTAFLVLKKHDPTA